jgi:hypothetical protein
MWAGILFTLGALAMSQTAPAQEKKAETFTFDGVTYTERVAVKQWISMQKGFLNPVQGVWANRVEVKDKGLAFRLLGKTKPGADLSKTRSIFRVSAEKGSVITDAAGNEYVATGAEGSDFLWVALTKEAPKPAPAAKK